MSAIVPHRRPEFDTDTIKSGLPVSGIDWGTLAGLSNWCMGHGGMLIPWSAIGRTISSGSTETFYFTVAPKASIVERVWRLTLLSGTDGATATVTAGGASAVDFTPPTTRDGRRQSYTVRESLSSKTGTSELTSVQVQATGGDITVESVACYEQTRRVLDADTNDYGVDLTTLRPRQPIADLDHKAIAGVCDAYKNLNARRSTLFQWSTPAAHAISPGSTSLTDLFPLHIPMAGAIPTTGDTTSSVAVVILGKVDTGTGKVRFSSDQAGDSADLSVTSTTTASVSDTLTIETEDLTVADGRQSNAWEAVRIQASDPAGGTLEIESIAILVTSTPV